MARISGIQVKVYRFKIFKRPNRNTCQYSSQASEACAVLCFLDPSNLSSSRRCGYRYPLSLLHRLDSPFCSAAINASLSPLQYIIVASCSIPTISLFPHPRSLSQAKQDNCSRNTVVSFPSLFPSTSHHLILQILHNASHHHPLRPRRHLRPRIRQPSPGPCPLRRWRDRLRRLRHLLRHEIHILRLRPYLNRHRILLLRLRRPRHLLRHDPNANPC